MNGRCAAASAAARRALSQVKSASFKSRKPRRTSFGRGSPLLARWRWRWLWLPGRRTLTLTVTLTLSLTTLNVLRWQWRRLPRRWRRSNWLPARQRRLQTCRQSAAAAKLCPRRPPQARSFSKYLRRFRETSWRWIGAEDERRVVLRDEGQLREVSVGLDIEPAQARGGVKCVLRTTGLLVAAA